ncbi:alanine racemase, partial [Klebsiella pneumoniae]
LAEQRGQTLRINAEIDVGLHRGGFEDPEALGRALASLKGGQPLQWRGFMGYDAHVAALPDLPGIRATAWDETQRRYRAAWAATEAALGPQRREALT